MVGIYRVYLRVYIPGLTSQVYLRVYNQGVYLSGVPQGI